MAANPESEPHTAGLVQEIERFRQKFADMMKTMADAEDGSLRSHFMRFSAQLEHYFELENRLMEHSDYPKAEHHRQEHHAMLNELQYFMERIDNGLFSLGRTYVTVRLPEWFAEHAESHDEDLKEHLANNGLAMRSAA
jgi:hemerythrin